ncbi:ParB/RepB/Spo0J family partition protein [Piscirickettsia salmonis]|uniref:ParB/RepB/Spo0J family partition protein n=1 Tax=Piscirickettsia salmonis TaxID=1238 RepID=UPI00166269D1|nr:ParB/RepB/Spo0J family partition protein [Piscirickettsia salmonis]QNR82692.1 ParB/RepB/Spo0J family partition protein [Piscirickettsia salmonis]
MAVVRKRNKKKKPKLKGEQDFVEATVFSRELWAATNEIKIADIKIDRNIKDDKAIKSLASSMEGKRQINACIVRESSDGGYELISGECRYEAAKINQEPLLVRVVECSDEEAAQIIIAENEQRVDLCDYDKALTYVEYMKMFNIKSIRDFSKQFKVSKTQVGRLLQVDSIPGVREVLPMEILGASQIEELAKRTKNSNPQSDCYEEGIISLSHKLSRVGTRSGSGLLSRFSGQRKF